MTRFELPLTSKNLIVTRSVDSMSNVRNLFQKKGAKIFDLPSLMFEYPDDLLPLDDALTEIEDFQDDSKNLLADINSIFNICDTLQMDSEIRL